MLNKIYFVTSPSKIREMAYGDSVYAWLLLHSHYDETEDHNYIYENEFTFSQISKDIHKHRDTVSKRFKKMTVDYEISNGTEFISYDRKNKVYYLPCFKDFEKLDAETVLNLFWICGQKDMQRKEELIKLYAWLKKRVNREKKKSLSYEDIILAFGHSKGNEETYNKYKELLTTL